jgi:hypothetical protein
MIFNCGAGWYSRSAIVCAKGVTIGDGIRPIKPEEIQDNWDAIKGLEGAKPLDSLANSFEYMMPLLQ